MFATSRRPDTWTPPTGSARQARKSLRTGFVHAWDFAVSVRFVFELRQPQCFHCNPGSYQTRRVGKRQTRLYEAMRESV